MRLWYNLPQRCEQTSLGQLGLVPHQQSSPFPYAWFQN
ncbi:Uncharacterised protein [Vibrio cholerae]|nr:Uncharacterised protein [Vibrio cholerae]CSI56610.1 Uncharacterised protein [Vibrio cholerae]